MSHNTSAFGSQLSPVDTVNGGEIDSIERRLYHDVYMREDDNEVVAYGHRIGRGAPTGLSHLIQPPTLRHHNGNIRNYANGNTNNNNNRGERGGIEETIIIYAPKGKLGVVIDTPIISSSHYDNENDNNNNHNKTMPIVHAIKDTCPIRSQIRVGDKLLKVDDEDVTYMTAVQVSRLIGRKCDQEKRKLTIVRCSRGGGIGISGGGINW